MKIFAKLILFMLTTYTLWASESITAYYNFDQKSNLLCNYPSQIWGGNASLEREVIFQVIDGKLTGHAFLQTQKDSQKSMKMLEEKSKKSYHKNEFSYFIKAFKGQSAFKFKCLPQFADFIPRSLVKEVSKDKLTIGLEILAEVVDNDDLRQRIRGTDYAKRLERIEYEAKHLLNLMSENS